MKIIKNIKQKRKELGLTQEELADYAGVSVRTIRDLENGNRKVKKNTLERVSDILDFEITHEEYISDYITIKFKSIKNVDNDKLLELNEKLIEAENLVNEKRYNEALDIYISLAKIFEKDMLYLLNCAILFERIDEILKAIEYCDKILCIDEYNYEALCIKGISLGRLKKYNESIEILKKALEIKRSSEIFYNIGVGYHMTDDIYSAIDYYEKCIGINPDFEDVHLNLGICYLRRFNYDKSLYHLNKALDLDEKMYQAYATLGSYYRDLGEADKAIKYFEKCLELDGDNYEALYGIFMCLGTTGNELKAKYYSQKFFALYGDIFFGKENSEKIDKQRDNAFIGTTEIIDETGSLIYPTMGKIFNDECRFNETIDKIKDSIKLFQVSKNKPLYFNFENEIKVTVVKLKSGIMFEIIFGKYNMIETQIDSYELETFIELYNKYKQFRIQLQFKTQMFVIDIIKDVSFKL